MEAFNGGPLAYFSLRQRYQAIWSYSLVVTLYAHTKPGCLPIDWEPLEVHLEKVARSAAAFADVFQAKDWGQVVGQCHDLGKFSEDFQNYLNEAGSKAVDAGAEDDADTHAPGKRVDHSTFGARFIEGAVDGIAGHLLAFCVAGHHTGLPDETSNDDLGRRSTLRHKLDAARYPIAEARTPAMELPRLTLSLKQSDGDTAFQLSFFTRMLFSCLIDADRTCTEEFCDLDRSAERKNFGSSSVRPTLVALKTELDRSLSEMQGKANRNEVNRQRAIVLDHCRQAAKLPPGFFSLNVPTGGGKTLSSLAFALEHALHKDHNLRRIVMAIPYTSIIEQTADAYRKALGPLAEKALVEHHTNLQPRHDTRSNQFGVENWDAPIVVTTNVQLLESLFSYRTTPCRKLHNLARSVIVLDEAQTIPVELLKPTLAALKELVLNYGCSIVLCTATQPALERRNDFDLGIENVRPIIPDSAPLFRALRRVQVHRLGKQSDDQLAMLMLREHGALCIVNTRKHASRLYDKLHSVADADECFHLSTWMCGEHRRNVLQTIRERLKQGKICRVVSTQLVEAGVDLDFPAVYRAEAGFDSIAQAAGRCNREGKSPMGITYVFEAEERPPEGLLRSAADTARELYAKHSDPLDPAAVEAYFKLFYWTKKSQWDKHGVMTTMDIDHTRKRLLFQFREMAARYRIIRDEQFPVLVPYDRDPNAINPIWGKMLGNKIMYMRQREIQSYLVSVRKQAVQQMQQRGFVSEHQSGVWILLNRSLYNQEKGLGPEATTLDSALWDV
jgi:CRISPR-associated endonuclease/helicase Cas3